MINLRSLRKPLRNIALCMLFLAESGAVTTVPGAQAGAVTSTEKGPPVGQKIPAFTAHDQFGKQQTLASLTGSEGLVLLFVRSADW